MHHRLTRPLAWLLLVAVLATSMPAYAQTPAPPPATPVPPTGAPTSPPANAAWPFPVAEQPPPPAPMPLLDGDAARKQPPPSMPQPLATVPITATPPAPVTKTLEPPPEVHRPSLALDLAVAPAILMVGETATFTVTVHNLAADPADDLVLSVPVPDKVVAQSGPTTQGNHGAWHWNLGHLDGQAQTTVSATFKVTGALRGQAVVLVAQATARDVAYLLGDHLGSMSWSRDLNGTFVGGAEYGPYGEVRAASGTLLSESHNFTGQLLDSTGLLYYHARYYDPALGRFLSPDSVVPDPANPQVFNRYSYVLNNPVRYTDPTGHCSFDQCNSLVL